MTGLVVEIPPPADRPHAEAEFFRLEVSEVALTYVRPTSERRLTERDHLVIES